MRDTEELWDYSPTSIKLLEHRGRGYLRYRNICLKPDEQVYMRILSDRAFTSCSQACGSVVLLMEQEDLIQVRESEDRAYLCRELFGSDPHFAAQYKGIHPTQIAASLNSEVDTEGVYESNLRSFLLSDSPLAFRSPDMCHAETLISNKDAKRLLSRYSGLLGKKIGELDQYQVAKRIAVLARHAGEQELVDSATSIAASFSRLSGYGLSSQIEEAIRWQLSFDKGFPDFCQNLLGAIKSVDDLYELLPAMVLFSYNPSDLLSRMFSLNEERHQHRYFRFLFEAMIKKPESLGESTGSMIPDRYLFGELLFLWQLAMIEDKEHEKMSDYLVALLREPPDSFDPSRNDLLDMIVLACSYEKPLLAQEAMARIQPDDTTGYNLPAVRYAVKTYCSHPWVTTTQRFSAHFSYALCRLSYVFPRLISCSNYEYRERVNLSTVWGYTAAAFLLLLGTLNIQHVLDTVAALPVVLSTMLIWILITGFYLRNLLTRRVEGAADRIQVCYPLLFQLFSAGVIYMSLRSLL